MSKAKNDPLISFEKNGRAAVLQYNLPTSSTYSGIRLVDLEIDTDWFTEDAKKTPDSPSEYAPGIVLDPPPSSIVSLPDRIITIVDNLRETGDADDGNIAGLWDPILAEVIAKDQAVNEGKIRADKALDELLRVDIPGPLYKEFSVIIETAMREAYEWMSDNLEYTSLWMDGYKDMVSQENISQEDSNLVYHSILPTQTPKSKKFTNKKIVTLAQSNRRVVPTMLQSGEIIGNVVTEPNEAQPRIVLVEHYRLSSYLGNYGAGKTLNTFTLLPGEESTITIRTWKQIKEILAENSSILDSYEEGNANEFQKDIQKEHSNKDKVDEANSWGVEANASATWAWGSASVKAEAKGSHNSSREDFARNVNNTLSKHSANASHQRKIEINSSTERQEEEGEEISVTRILKNLNLSRVMNFVFRELNQEFISYLHLVDLRIAFVNGFPQSTRVYTLSELDNLLDWAIIEEKDRNLIKDSIINAYKSLLDFNDEPCELVKWQENEKDGFWRVRRGALSDDKELEEGQKFDEQTSGIIVKKMINILPTDAIIVDALLGEGIALDQFALSSQEEAIRAKRIANALSESEKDKLDLALKIIENKDTEMAQLFSQLFPPVRVEEEGGDE
jgi:hypothetical protein